MLRRLVATAGLLSLFAAPAQAQIPLLDIRVGAQGALPQGTFGDVYDAGLGAYARVGVPVLFFKLMGSATYTRFKAVNPLTPELNVTTLQIGPHFSPIPLLDIGAELAYDSDSKKTGFAPNVSVGFLFAELTGSYTMIGDSKWMSVGVGLRF